MAQSTPVVPRIGDNGARRLPRPLGTVSECEQGGDVPQVGVQTADGSMLLDENERLTFGRARDCTVCLDPEDTGISRVAGTIEFDNGTWWIANSSATRPLLLVDDLGFRSLLPPQRRAAVEGRTQVIIDGTRGQHTIKVAVDGARAVNAPDGVDTAEGVPTAIGAEVMISATDKLAMVALFAGYLEDPPRYDPYPKSYAAAAARLGCNRTTLVKRIEYLRVRLDAAGVPNMMGFAALTNLAEYAISRGLITRQDLVLLKR
jgi:hypothetical protein